MAVCLHLLAHPDSRRVVLFQEALAARGESPAQVIPWADCLRGGIRLGRVLAAGWAS